MHLNGSISPMHSGGEPSGLYHDTSARASLIICVCMASQQFHQVLAQFEPVELHTHLCSRKQWLGIKDSEPDAFCKSPRHLAVILRLGGDMCSRQ